MLRVESLNAHYMHSFHILHSILDLLVSYNIMRITLTRRHSACISSRPILEIEDYHDMDRQAARCQCDTAEAQESPGDAIRGVRWWQQAQNHAVKSLGGDNSYVDPIVK